MTSSPDGLFLYRGIRRPVSSSYRTAGEVNFQEEPKAAPTGTMVRIRAARNTKAPSRIKGTICDWFKTLPNPPVKEATRAIVRMRMKMMDNCIHRRKILNLADEYTSEYRGSRMWSLWRNE